MSVFHALFFLFVGIGPGSSAFATPEEVESVGCESELAPSKDSSFATGQMIVDSQLGFLRVVDYDSTTDTLTVSSADRHRTYVESYGHHIKGRLTPFRLLNASTRATGLVGSKAASKIIRARVESSFGWRRPAFYFALLPIGLRLHDSGHEEWIRNILFPILREVVDQELNNVEDVKSLVDGWRRWIFQPQGSLATVDMGQQLTKIIQLIEFKTGENLIRSGLLQSYAGDYKRGWRGDGFPKSVKIYHSPSKAKKSVDVYEWVPQDIDHYLRSTLWTNPYAFAPLLEPKSTGDVKFMPPTDLIVALQPELTALAQKIAARDGRKIVEIERRQKPETSWMPVFTSRKWRQIYEMAGTVVVPKDIINSKSVLLLKSVDTDLALVSEVVRLLYNNGAREVRVIDAIN